VKEVLDESDDGETERKQQEMVKYISHQESAQPDDELGGEDSINYRV